MHDMTLTCISTLKSLSIISLKNKLPSFNIHVNFFVLTLAWTSHFKGKLFLFYGL
jgi:hypothetical protein